MGLVVNQLWWLLPFIFLIAMPGVYLSMWAVPLLAPAIVGVLYMTEISAAAISSALWSGEPFGIREILGIALITVAAVLESVRDLWRDRRAAPTLTFHFSSCPRSTRASPSPQMDPAEFCYLRVGARSSSGQIARRALACLLVRLDFI